MKSVAIMWFRRDLRLSDNPALVAAARHGTVLPLWIDDQAEAGERAPGAALQVWQRHSLQALDDSLQGQLNIRQGTAQAVLQDLMQQFDVQAVYWNRCYEPWRVDRDTELKSWLQDQGIRAESHNGALLWEPWEIKKSDGTPYRVFTPFFRNGCLAAPPPRRPLPRPEGLTCAQDAHRISLSQLSDLPSRPWAGRMMSHWTMGERAAQAQLADFMASGLEDYKEGRNFPAQRTVSRLSPYLQSGEISPHQVWHAVRDAATDVNAQHFCSELGWREFSYSLLWHQRDLHRVNLQSKFDNFSWADPGENLQAWQRGETGIAIVDAGMRELWQTGYMHNRVRMIAASFLVKNLLIDWRHGESWFWDTLVDADPANNPASWQWVAGCGADAAPYFRIFNPVTQAKKFDPSGDYIRKWVPELAGRATKDLFSLPETAAPRASTYPAPIVDLKLSRTRALSAFSDLTA